MTTPNTKSTENPPSKSTRSNWAFLVVVVAVVGWFVASEAATAWWYGSNEAQLPRNQVPTNGDEVVERLKAFANDQGAFAVKVEGVGTAAMEMLKCNFGETVSWNSGLTFSAASVLKWDERSAVAGTEAVHNPGICLRGAGWTILGTSDLGVMQFDGTTAEVTEWDVEQGGIKMKAFISVFRRFAYQEKDSRNPRRYWNAARLDPVFDGRRDAPLMILLVYLPVDFAETPEGTRERFRSIMQAALAAPSQAQAMR